MKRYYGVQRDDVEEDENLRFVESKEIVGHSGDEIVQPRSLRECTLQTNGVAAGMDRREGFQHPRFMLVLLMAILNDELDAIAFILDDVEDDNE